MSEVYNSSAVLDCISRFQATCICGELEHDDQHGQNNASPTPIKLRFYTDYQDPINIRWKAHLSCSLSDFQVKSPLINGTYNVLDLVWIQKSTAKAESLYFGLDWYGVWTLLLSHTWAHGGSFFLLRWSLNSCHSGPWFTGSLREKAVRSRRKIVLLGLPLLHSSPRLNRIGNTVTVSFD